jgi:hypothetical protein
VRQAQSFVAEAAAAEVPADAGNKG